MMLKRGKRMCTYEVNRFVEVNGRGKMREEVRKTATPPFPSSSMVFLS